MYTTNYLSHAIGNSEYRSTRSRASLDRSSYVNIPTDNNQDVEVALASFIFTRPECVFRDVPVTFLKQNLHLLQDVSLRDGYIFHFTQTFQNLRQNANNADRRSSSIWRWHGRGGREQRIAEGEWGRNFGHDARRPYPTPSSAVQEKQEF